MQARINLLENTLIQKNNVQTNISSENFDQIEGTSHALEILRALIERSNSHFETNGK